MTGRLRHVASRTRAIARLGLNRTWQRLGRGRNPARAVEGPAGPTASSAAGSSADRARTGLHGARERLRRAAAGAATAAGAGADALHRGVQLGLAGPLGAVTIALVGALVYVNATPGAFHFDDSHAVEDNPSIRSLANLGRFFLDPTTFSVLPQNTGYRPVLLVTFALNATIGGDHPASFIVGNLLVHLLCALLVRALVRGLARRLQRPDADQLAFVATALFAVHPLFSECVNYVSARSESLSSALALVALLLWLRAREDRRWLAAAAVTLLAAMLTKPVVMTLPVFAALILWTIPAERSLRPIRSLERLAWLAAPAAAGAALVLWMTPALTKVSASSLDRWTYIRSQFPATLHYLRLFVWPVGQSADAHYPVATSFAQPEVWLSSVALVAVLAWTTWALATRRWSGAALAISWFFLCLALTAVFPLAEIVNEHRPYLAAAGLCVLAAHALLRLPAALVPVSPGGASLARVSGAARLASPVAITAVLCVLGALTVARNRIWRDDASLWKDVVDKAPLSTRAHMNYGLALMARGYRQQAEVHLREAVRLAPGYSYARVNLGAWLMAGGAAKEAAHELDLAISLDPQLFYAHFFRGRAATMLAEPPAERERHFAAAVALSPHYAEGWYQLALARDARGDRAGTIQAAARAAGLRGSYDDRFMHGYALLQARQATAAMPILNRLARERPDDKRVTYNLTYASRLLGH